MLFLLITLQFIGNTGSGKSCGVARILQNLYGNKETMPVNSHIVLFDVYGEYKHALSHLNDIDGMGYKNLTSKLDLSDGELINIPAYFLEVDDLALLLHVTNSSSLPNKLERSQQYAGSISSLFFSLISAIFLPSSIFLDGTISAVFLLILMCRTYA